MSDLLVFIIQARLEYWRKQFSEDTFVGLYLLLLVFLLSYSVLIGFFINTDSASIQLVQAGHLAFLFGYYWLISLSPWYSSKTYLFNITHPLKSSTKFFLELLYNLFDVYLILFLLIHIVVAVIAHNYPFEYNIQALLVLLLSFLTQQIFRLVLDGKALKQSLGVLLASVIITTGAGYSIFYLSDWLTIGILLVSLISVTGLFYLASKEAYSSLPTYQSSSRVRNPWFSLYFKQRFWQIMAMALFVKILFLFGSGLSTSEEEGVKLGLMWGIILTPLTIIEYGFANLFGHFPKLVLAIEANNGRLLDYARFYLRMLLPVLLIDQLIDLMIIFIFDI
ncbi:MAG: hypothetical protein AAF632_00180 [Bacteroidota bacterium]